MVNSAAEHSEEQVMWRASADGPGTRAVSLAHLLRQQRRAAGLTQEELAERAGLSVRAISNIERGAGHRPRRDTAILLANALQLDEAARELFLTSVKAVHAAGERKLDTFHNLPHSTTSFVGRVKEIALLDKKLRLPASRLLTLTGAGGSGKTRLSIQVAYGLLDEFVDGILFVPLALVRDVRMVPSEIAAALGLSEQGSEDIRRKLIRHLGEKRSLLVLDNLEHVLDATAFLADLLETCPLLSLLVTSRSVLGLSSETVFEVAPLTMPDPSLVGVGALSGSDAVTLFLERAGGTSSSFAEDERTAVAVASICYQLDGLPLAIELAAARLRLFSPEALLARLQGSGLEIPKSSSLQILTGGPKDLPVRQRTLRGTIDWSYDLLSEEDRKLLARLAVFTGSWSTEAVEAVCNAAGDLGINVMDGLSALVDGSLVYRSDETSPGLPSGGYQGARFGMLETIREYATERLEASGDADSIRRLHVEFFTHMAEKESAEQQVAIKLEWLDRLEADRGNLHAALQWTVEQREGELGLRLATALGAFWETRDNFDTGRRWLSRLLSIDEGESSIRARALCEAGRLALMPWDLVAAKELTHKSVAMCRALHDSRGLIEALHHRGELAIRQNDVGSAKALGEEALTLARTCREPRLTSRALWRLAWLSAMEGDRERARMLAEESLGVCRRLADNKGIGEASEVLLYIARLEADVDEQRRRFEECLASLIETAVYDDADRAFWLERNSFLARAAGEYWQATTLMETAISVSANSRNRFATAVYKVHLAHLLREQGQYDRAAELFEESLAFCRATEHLDFYYRAMHGLSDIARDRGDSERCISLAQQCLTFARENKKQADSAFAHHNIGVGAGQQREFMRAESHLDTALAIMPLPDGRAEIAASRGTVALDQGDVILAREMFVMSLRLARSAGWEHFADVQVRWVFPSPLEGLAAVAANQGESQLAVHCLSVAAAMRASMGTPVPIARLQALNRLTVALKDTMGGDRFAVAWAEGDAMKEEQAVSCALGEHMN